MVNKVLDALNDNESGKNVCTGGGARQNNVQVHAELPRNVWTAISILLLSASVLLLSVAWKILE